MGVLAFLIVVVILLYVGQFYIQLPFLYLVGASLVAFGIYLWFAIGWLRRLRLWQTQQRPNNPPKDDSENKGNAAS